MRIFVLTHGRYDEYSIIGVYSSHKKALENIPDETYNEYHIEEYDLDDIQS